MVARGTESLVFADMTSDGSSGINSEVYGAMLCAQIQPNAAKQIGQDNDPNHSWKIMFQWVEIR